MSSRETVNTLRAEYDDKWGLYLDAREKALASVEPLRAESAQAFKACCRADNDYRERLARGDRI